MVVVFTFFSEAYVVVFYFFAETHVVLLAEALCFSHKHRLCFSFSRGTGYASRRNKPALPRETLLFIGALFFSRSMVVFRKKNKKQFSKIHEN